MTAPEEILTAHGVRPTANRILIIRQMLAAGRPVSMLEIEDALESVDKSIISRTLAAFREHHMLHTIEDGSESVRYELCRSHAHSCGDDSCSDDDSHVHFHCELCGRTFCFEDIPVPAVALPEGFQTHFVNFVAKGICPNCRSGSSRADVPGNSLSAASSSFEDGNRSSLASGSSETTK